MENSIKNETYERIIASVREFLEVLKNDGRYDLPFKLQIEPDRFIIKEENIESSKYIVDSKEFHNKKVIHGLDNLLNVAEENYVKFRSTDNYGVNKPVDEMDFFDAYCISLVRDISSRDRDDSEVIIPLDPFEVNKKEIYVDLVSTLIYGNNEPMGYNLYLKLDEGILLIFDYYELLDKELIGFKRGFESVSYNFKTKELSFGNDVMVKE